jgi:hypothetical protein
MMKADDHAAGQLVEPPHDSAEPAFAEAIMLSDEGYKVKYKLEDLSVVGDALKDLGVCHLPDHRGGHNQLEWWSPLGR